ncbi:CRE-SRX-84 protein [Caenorhabditis remanei]|uniref:CRE-SRX-84 protein n=1 Tax=Caenorhabditis remanei TaxID=31234 RepID=E3LPM5_CAERE|nr:CRE-SRX-84 protein [Caenorhabditis remanei]
MSTTAPNYTDILNLSAAFIILVIGIIGLVSNFFIIYIFIKSAAERTSFNIICVSRAVVNIIIIAWAFLGTFLPITLIGVSPFSPFYETLVIGIANSLYSGFQVTGMYIAINRFCAMYFTMYYSKFFGFKTTLFITSLLFLYRLVRITMQFFRYIPRECWLTYTSIDLTWFPNMDPKCEEDHDYQIDATAIFLVAMGLLNAATFSKIYFFYKSTDLDVKERRRKQKKNQALFIQTMIQDAVILIDMVFTYKLSLLSNKRAWSFFCGTVIWQCVHSFDGVIMVLFNERLTFIKKTLFTPSSASPSVVLPGKTNSVTPSMYPSRVE